MLFLYMRRSDFSEIYSCHCNEGAQILSPESIWAPSSEAELPPRTKHTLRNGYRRPSL